MMRPPSQADFAVILFLAVPALCASTPSNPKILRFGAGSASRVPGTADVVMARNDLLRTGQNLQETALTLALVNKSSFGLRFKLPVDGKVDAQPLALANIVIGTVTRNVVYTATEHDSVYAYDSDDGSLLWQKSMLAAGETPSDNRSCNQVVPEIGVTATPVIDRAKGVMFLIAMSKDSGGGYHQRLHALSLLDGSEQLGGPVSISATYKYPGGYMSFDPKQYKERSALLEYGGKIYLSWASHCDIQPYSGWVMGYDATTLKLYNVWNSVPGNSTANAGEASFWNAGGGPGIDASGNLYLMSGNGDFDTTLDGSGFPNKKDYGNAFIKLAPVAGTMTVLDYFTMSNTVAESAADIDLGSGGLMLLPDVLDSSGAVRHVVLGAGKDNVFYVMDRDNMGKFNASADNIWQEIPNAFPGASEGSFSNPAYFNNKVYLAATGTVLRAFNVTNAKLGTTASSQSTASFPYPGATPSVSANGSSNGIVWAVANSGSQGVLHAYNAANLATELYTSAQSGARDQFGPGDKFNCPTVANGKVFVGTQADNTAGGQNYVAVFGLF